MKRIKIPVPEKDGKHKVRNIIVYRDDHPLREKMIKQLLEEVLEVEATEDNIRAFDAVPYINIIRPLLIRDCSTAGFGTLSIRYQLTKRVIMYNLTGE